MKQKLVVTCKHQWKGYGYCKRTDCPSQTLIFYECVGCGNLKTEESP
jgi:hypothetical protein